MVGEGVFLGDLPEVSGEEVALGTAGYGVGEKFHQAIGQESLPGFSARLFLGPDGGLPDEVGEARGFEVEVDDQDAEAARGQEGGDVEQCHAAAHPALVGIEGDDGCRLFGR